MTSQQLWLSLSIDGQIRDVRRLIVDGELGSLVPASLAHSLLSMYQDHLTMIAAAVEGWSVEILDPDSYAVVHIENKQPASTRFVGEAGR